MSRDYHRETNLLTFTVKAAMQTLPRVEDTYSLLLDNDATRLSTQTGQATIISSLLY